MNNLTRLEELPPHKESQFLEILLDVLGTVEFDSRRDLIMRYARREYEITSDEHRILSEVVTEFEDCTPRRIRIFYYQYLLARNLLDLRLMDKIDRRVLASALVNYSRLLEGGVTAHARLESRLRRIVIRNSQVNEATFRELFKVIQMTVAY